MPRERGTAWRERRCAFLCLHVIPAVTPEHREEEGPFVRTGSSTFSTLTSSRAERGASRHSKHSGQDPLSVIPSEAAGRAEEIVRMLGSLGIYHVPGTRDLPCVASFLTKILHTIPCSDHSSMNRSAQSERSSRTASPWARISHEQRPNACRHQGLVGGKRRGSKNGEPGMDG